MGELGVFAAALARYRCIEVACAPPSCCCPSTPLRARGDATLSAKRGKGRAEVPARQLAVDDIREAEMQVKMFKVLGGMAMGLSAMLAAPAPAQLSTTANGPYYATPSWDQKLTTNRFVILANWNSEAVLDRETGLVWERAPDSTFIEWGRAVFRCLNLAEGGRMGWRLPQVHELLSLVDLSVQTYPVLPAGHPFTVPDASPVTGFWAATTVSDSTDRAHVVSLNPVVSALLGRAPTIGKESAGRTWCVRGGIGAFPLR